MSIHKLSDFVELFESPHPNLSLMLDYDIHFHWVAFPFKAYTKLNLTSVWETWHFHCEGFSTSRVVQTCQTRKGMTTHVCAFQRKIEFPFLSFFFFLFFFFFSRLWFQLIFPIRNFLWLESSCKSYICVMINIHKPSVLFALKQFKWSCIWSNLFLSSRQSCCSWVAFWTHMRSCLATCWSSSPQRVPRPPPSAPTVMIEPDQAEMSGTTWSSSWRRSGSWRRKNSMSRRWFCVDCRISNMSRYRRH